MAGGFDPEAFKAQLKDELIAQLKEEMIDETRSMMKEMMGEITKLIRENQPVQPFTPIDLDTEILIGERKEDDVTVLDDQIGRKSVRHTENMEQPNWAKDLTKAVTQMQMMMKENGMNAPMDYTDLNLDEEDDPLPPKYRFLNMKKYSGTDDPHLHLKQYATYMKATGLSRVQIIKQFPMSLEGAPIRWYYALDPHVQSDWNELCIAFVKQYGLNVQLEVSLRDLQNTAQGSKEPFLDFLTRWRGKLAQMKHLPAESTNWT